MSLHELLRRGRGSIERGLSVYLSIFDDGRVDYYQNSLLKLGWTVGRARLACRWRFKGSWELLGSA